MRGVLRYGADAVVAILDSSARGRDARTASRSSARVDDALALRADDRARRRRDAGRPLPAGLARAPEELRSRPGSTSRTACTSSSPTTRSCVELAARHGVELRDLRKPPAGPRTSRPARTSSAGATIVLTVGSDCAIGKMTVALELDREARRRGLESVFVPTGQTGIAIAGWGISVDAVVADFIAGAAERLVVEGARARRRAALGRGPGRAPPPGLLRRHARPYPRQRRRTLFVLCHVAGRDRDRGRRGGHPIPPLAELVELHERIALPARPAKVAALALNTRARRGRGARGDRGGRGTRRACRRTIRSASAPGGSSTPSSLPKTGRSADAEPVGGTAVPRVRVERGTSLR